MQHRCYNINDTGVFGVVAAFEITKVRSFIIVTTKWFYGSATPQEGKAMIFLTSINWSLSMHRHAKHYIRA